jgi:hypothetical protein
MTATDEAPEPQPPDTWRERLKKVPLKLWALIVVPVIPIVAAAVVTQLLQPRSRPVLDITHATRIANITLGEFFAEQPAALATHAGVLGCDGTVLTIAMKLAHLERKPILRWSLQETRRLHSLWKPPPGFAFLQTAEVTHKENGATDVWVPFPAERGTWTPRVALYKRDADIPNAPADSWVGKTPIESIPQPPDQLTGRCEP